ncbi:hypothetical protein [Lake Baikal phage Baikal-20-5m-C28]|nr:hypothetical protein [Lake Baikal phage Baikal-20-5m-C28]
MPTYAYKCKKCEHYFEKLVKMAERDDAINHPCPECAGEIYRTMETAGLISDSMSITRRAGSEWADRLKYIKKSSGKVNTIKV